MIQTFITIVSHAHASHNSSARRPALRACQSTGTQSVGSASTMKNSGASTPSLQPSKRSKHLSTMVSKLPRTDPKTGEFARGSPLRRIVSHKAAIGTSSAVTVSKALHACLGASLGKILTQEPAAALA